jgi:uncharacterized membrane protein YphA (DoxX/SURF4 family)
MKNTINWILRLIPAIIFLQTLFFKFTAAPESVYIFEQMGMEPWGRIGTGIAELVASILILIPKYSKIGAAFGLLIIIGAIMSHLTQLGIEVQDDGGLLFYMALAIFICCAIYLFINRQSKLPQDPI